MSTLFVAALEEEVAALPSLPHGCDLVITGPGKTRATLGLSARLAHGPRPRTVVVLGTAGALRPGISGLVEPVRAVDHEFDATTLELLTGRPWPAELVLGSGPGHTMATGDRFVAGDRERLALASRGLDLVDMEAFAYAFVARSFDVPVRVVKYVTDAADGNATRTWPETVGVASRHLGDWVSTWLDGPARS